MGIYCITFAPVTGMPFENYFESVEGHMLFLCTAHLIDYQLLCEHEECSDEPVDADPRREEVGGSSDHKRHTEEHEVVHDAWIRHKGWLRFRVFPVLFFDDFLLEFLQFLDVALFWERELDLEPLRSSDRDGEDNPGYASDGEEMDSEEYCVNLGDVEIRESRVEIVVIGEIGDAEHDPVEDYEERHLDQERKTGSERIDLFGFIQSHKLHADLCLVTLVLFLEFLDLRLYRLHLLTVGEDVVLWDQKEDPDGDGYKNDREPETIPGNCGDEECEQVVDRCIEDIPEEGPEKTRNIAGRVGIGSLPVHGQAELVFPRRLEELVERSETEFLFGSILDGEGFAELRRRIREEIVVFFYGEIPAGVDGDARGSVVLNLDHRDIWTHVRSGSDMEDYFVSWSRVLFRARKDPVEHNQGDTEYEEKIQEAGVHEKRGYVDGLYGVPDTNRTCV